MLGTSSLRTSDGVWRERLRWISRTGAISHKESIMIDPVSALPYIGTMIGELKGLLPELKEKLDKLARYL